MKTGTLFAGPMGKIIMTDIKNLLLSLCLLLGLATVASGSEFLLFYSNDLHGEMEACG